MLKVADLRQACSLLLDEVERKFGGEVSLSAVGIDHYWNMDLRAAYGMTDQPEAHIDCGHSWDDVGEVAEMVQRDQGMIALWHDLDHVAGLLRLLAYLDLPSSPYAVA
ncbi:hypothetical protein DLE60_09420 [Micromonospora globispora]|nr:hypothetical protein DLE60_09420 [Micromonospora globispora]